MRDFDSSFDTPRSMNTLEKSELFEGLSVVHLKLSGLWYGINHYRRTERTSRFFQLYMATTILYVCPYVFFQVLCIFFISLDIKIATFIYMTGISTAQIWFKVIMFCYNFSDQCLLFDLLKIDFLSCIPQEKIVRVRQIYKRIARVCNIFSLLAFTGSTSTIVTWLIMPGFSTDGSITGRKKIASGWYPVPYSKSPWYEVVFSYEVVMMSWHGSLIALFQCVLLLPLMGLYAHFLVLGYLISTLGDEDKNNQSDYILNMELKKILKDYDKLLWFADHFRSTNSAIITIILGFDIAILILTILYILFGLGEALSTFKLMLFFSFATVEITLLCVSSSIVESASSDIGYAFYKSRWYTADKTFRTTGQMMMIRAMRPVTLTAVKMYPVNMETLINTFRFIYTAVAVLSKMK